MFNIYVPDDSTYTACYSVIDKDTIRAYDTQPQQNVSYNYRDYFVNSHYLYTDGTDIYDTSLPSCISASLITHDFYYRNDIADIFTVFFIFSLIVFSIPVLLLSKFRKRF